MKTTIAVDVTVDTLLDALDALILNHGGEVDRKYKFAVDDLEDMCQRYRVRLECQQGGNEQ